MTRALGRLLLVCGTVAIVVAAGKAHATMNGYDFTGSARFAWSIALILLLAVTSYGVGLPDLPRTTVGAAGAAAVSLGLSAIAISIVQLFLGDALLPRFVLGTSLLALLPWFLICSKLSRQGRVRQEGRDRVFVVASETDLASLELDLREGTELPARVVGHLDPGAAAQDVEVLYRSVVDAGATVLVLNRDAQQSDGIVHTAAALHEAGVRIRTLSLFYEQWLGRLPIAELERISLLYDVSELHRAVYARASRIGDVGLAVLGTAALAVVLPFVLVGNLVGNRGPLFYRQPRVGKNGQEFSILKFRTMRPSAGGMPNEWTTEDDPRITPFGRILRRTHVDEAPQMINILRGELSLVGPRPEQPHYVAELKEKLPFYDLRHLVRPGLTGWAQVKYGYAGSESDALEKLQYEFYYLRHQSLSFDAKILFRTLRRVLLATGR